MLLRNVICLESVFLGISSAGTAILRRGDVETIAQGERDVTRVVVLGLAEYHAVEIERGAPDALVKEVVAREFNVQAMFEQVFADAKGEHGVGRFYLAVRACIAMSVHAEVGLQHPVVRQGYDVAQLQREHGLVKFLLRTVEWRLEPLLHESDVILRYPHRTATQINVLLRAQSDNEPVGMIVVLYSDQIHFAILLQTLNRVHKRIYTMNEVGGKI